MLNHERCHGACKGCITISDALEYEADVRVVVIKKGAGGVPVGGHRHGTLGVVLPDIMRVDVVPHPLVGLLVGFEIAVQGVFRVGVVDAAGNFVEVERGVGAVEQDMADGHE